MVFKYFLELSSLDEIISCSNFISQLRREPEAKRYVAEAKPEAKLKEYNTNIFLPFHNWYFLVFCPLNSNYNPSYNAIDYIRKKFCNISSTWLITREVQATKYHYNLLIYSNFNMLCFHQKRLPRYFCHVQEVTSCSVNQVYNYMIKEYDNNWKEYVDYSLSLYKNEQMAV